MANKRKVILYVSVDLDFHDKLAEKIPDYLGIDEDDYKPLEIPVQFLEHQTIEKGDTINGAIVDGIGYEIDVDGTITQIAYLSIRVLDIYDEFSELQKALKDVDA